MSNYKRKKPSKNEKDTFYIICGGKTEKLYFDMFRQFFKDSLGGIKIRVLIEKADPIQLVDRAIKETRDKDNINEMWVVFDKDQFPTFDEALVKANVHNIRCAFSNQAFELWFINHYMIQTAPLHRTEYSNSIQKLSGVDYTKKVKDLKALITKLLDKELLNSAINNSRISYEQHAKNHCQDKQHIYSNYESCTTVYKLVNRILKAHT